ncbi:hypothetical protein C5F59_019315 [Streptomyces sp. QL37]|nr:hypothetical protein [Streptomyces sp. QL37]
MTAAVATSPPPAAPAPAALGGSTGLGAAAVRRLLAMSSGR